MCRKFPPRVHSFQSEMIKFFQLQTSSADSPVNARLLVSTYYFVAKNTDRKTSFKSSTTRVTKSKIANLARESLGRAKRAAPPAATVSNSLQGRVVRR
jgi:hypothetical protein